MASYLLSLIGLWIGIFGMAASDDAERMAHGISAILCAVLGIAMAIWDSICEGTGFRFVMDVLAMGDNLVVISAGANVGWRM